MIILAGLLGGAVYGAMLAKRRDGTRLDMAQYAAGFGIAFAIVGVFATIALEYTL